MRPERTALKEKASFFPTVLWKKSKNRPSNNVRRGPGIFLDERVADKGTGRKNQILKFSKKVL